MNDPVTNSFVDDALLDAAESFWDEDIERIIRRSYGPAKRAKRHGGCSKLDMTT